MMTDTYTLYRGTAPLVVSVPHVGRWIPEELRPRLHARAWACEDADWHLERIYRFAHDELGASLIVPKASRYFVDLNRPPENTPMYPGVNNTELCPTRFFTGDPLYRDGQTPNEAEIQQRVCDAWQPYHSALRAELDRLRSSFGHVVLWDGHSICSELPWLFAGKLPDLNLGTASERSCAASLQRQLADALCDQTDYSHVINGRFKGGYITRHYGQPESGVHAIQMEMCWSTYMVEHAPFELSPDRWSRLAPRLRQWLQICVDWKPHA